MTEKLLPCPFCGSAEIQFKAEGYFQPWKMSTLELWYHCACYKCGGAKDDGGHKDMNSAAKAWNDRNREPVLKGHHIDEEGTVVFIYDR